MISVVWVNSNRFKSSALDYSMNAEPIRNLVMKNMLAVILVRLIRRPPICPVNLLHCHSGYSIQKCLELFQLVQLQI